MDRWLIQSPDKYLFLPRWFCARHRLAQRVKILAVSKRKWTEDIYLVTEGDLRMTDSRVLDRGGMSSSDSEGITSSGWVIFKNETTPAFITPLIELLKNVIRQVPYHAQDMWDIGKRQTCCLVFAVARTF